MANTKFKFSVVPTFRITIAFGATVAFATPSAAQISGSAEAQVRIYAAIAGATNNMVDQLLGLDPITHTRPKNYANPSNGIETYILFDPRMNSDMAMAAKFKIPMDTLYQAIYNPGNTLTHPVLPRYPLPASAGALDGVSLPGVISTLSSIAGISPALFAQTTAQSAAGGTTDADAFIATQLIARFAEWNKWPSIANVNIYAPSIFPLLTSSNPDLKSLSNPATGNTPYTPDNTDPLTEFTMLQSDVAFLLRNEQTKILKAYTEFSTYTAPIAGSSTAATPNVPAAYTTLVNDLKAAIAWLPPVATGAPGSTSPTGVGTPTSALPYASIQSDIQLLNSTLVKYQGLNDAPLYDHLRTATANLAMALPPVVGATPNLRLAQPNLLDSTIQIAEALSAIGAALATSVSPYGTVSSASPSAATPSTIADIVTRGWQVTKLLNTEGCKVLRIHLEVGQGTDKTTSYAIKWFKDSSAMALLSFMVLDKPTDGDFATITPGSIVSHTDNVKLASWSMAYYPFQNGDNALNLDRLQILWPGKFDSSFKTKQRD